MLCYLEFAVILASVLAEFVGRFRCVAYGVLLVIFFATCVLNKQEKHNTLVTLLWTWAALPNPRHNHPTRTSAGVDLA